MPASVSEELSEMDFESLDGSILDDIHASQSVEMMQVSSPQQQQRPVSPPAVDANAIPFPESRFRSLLETIGFATPPVSQVEKERQLEVLQQMRETGALKGISARRASVVAVGNPEFAKALEKYDTNGDGHIDTDEINAVFTELNNRKHQTDLLKKILAFAGVFLVLLLVFNSLLTVWMIKLTKDVYIADDSMVSSKGDMLKTEKPKFYTSISSLTSLPAGALDAITRMTFTTVDGGVYNLMVNGKRE
jgi:hypothetical protein